LARYAEFAGWLHQDAGDLAAAMYWSDRATQWAQATHDQTMQAYLLIRKANIALLADDPGEVIELAAAARQVPGPLSPRLIALAAQQEARGWALHGDADRFEQEIETAATLLRKHPVDRDLGAPVYLHHYDLDVLEEQSATGYRACGRADTAVNILERKIKSTPEHLHRDRAHLQAKLANAVLATKDADPRMAIALGLRSAAGGRRTGSARIGKELLSLDVALARDWPTVPGRRELHDAVQAFQQDL